MWAQSLYLLGNLLREGLISVGEIDPLGRHLHVQQQRQPLVQVALLTKDEALQSKLSAYGIDTQTPSQIAPIQMRPASDLTAVYSQIGRNDKLGLTGRPSRRLRILTTSRIFSIRGETIVFLPSFLDLQQFYLTSDPQFLVAQIRAELAHIQRHWSQLGRPTLTLLLTHTIFEAATAPSNQPSPMLKLLQDLADGNCNGVPVKLGHLNQLMQTASIERIDFLHDFEFAASIPDRVQGMALLPFSLEQTTPLDSHQEFALEYETNSDYVVSRLQQSGNLYEQVELISTLMRLQEEEKARRLAAQAAAAAGEADGESAPRPVQSSWPIADWLDQIYTRAAEHRLWAIVRRAAGLNSKVIPTLADAVNDILARQKQIAIGRSYSEYSLITRPEFPMEIVDKINEFCREDIRDRMLTQEILIYLSLLIRSEPELFNGLLTLRVGYLILLLTGDLAGALQVTQDEAYERLMQLNPYEIQTRLHQVLVGYEGLARSFFQQESLHVKQQEQVIDWVILPSASEGGSAAGEGGWRRKRQLDGSLNRVSKQF